MNSKLKIGAIIVLFLVLCIIAFTFNSKTSWIGHALASLAGIMLMILAIASGAMLAGRIQKGTANLYKIHRNASIYFSCFILGAFLYEMWLRFEHNRPLLNSIHGRLGLIIILIIIIQVATSLIIKDRSSLKMPHRILGYSIAPLLILDASFGLNSAVIAGTNNLVLLHSVSGGLAALALIWLIIELSYLIDEGVMRARVASYLASILIICSWLIGGYNYLTVYSFQVKPVILSGPRPWAQTVVMETKEHIFLFLPLIAVALTLSLSCINKDTLLKDSRMRHDLIVIASLAFFLTLLVLLMGAITSNAGKLGIGGLK